jgi:Rod binding domain-containing protein
LSCCEQQDGLRQMELEERTKEERQQMRIETVHGIGAAAEAGPSPKLVQAAREFEAQLMKELLRPMTASGNSEDEVGDDTDAGSNGALGEFAAEAMGKALSAEGGFGIANQIVRELSGHGNHGPSGK